MIMGNCCRRCTKQNDVEEHGENRSEKKFKCNSTYPSTDDINRHLATAFIGLFERVDRNHDGVIDKSDLCHLFESLGEKPNDKDLRRFLKRLSTDSDFTLDFTQFVKIMAPKSRKQDLEEQIVVAFEALRDGGDDNSSTADGLVTIGELDGAGLSEEDIQNLLHDEKINANGNINYYEFARAVGL